jgi:hypothetical protein
VAHSGHRRRRTAPGAEFWSRRRELSTAEPRHEPGGGIVPVTGMVRVTGTVRATGMAGEPGRDQGLTM